MPRETRPPYESFTRAALVRTASSLVPLLLFSLDPWTKVKQATRVRYITANFRTYVGTLHKLGHDDKIQPISFEGY